VHPTHAEKRTKGLLTATALEWVVDQFRSHQDPNVNKLATDMRRDWYEIVIYETATHRAHPLRRLYDYSIHDGFMELTKTRY